MYQKIRSFLFQWRTPLLMILTFFLGAITGIFTESAVLITELRSTIGQGPETICNLVQSRLTYRLGLDAKQQKELKPILDDTATKVKEIRSQIAPQVQSLITDAAGRIEKILRPDQVLLLHDIEERARKRFGSSPFFPTQLNSLPSDNH